MTMKYNLFPLFLAFCLFILAFVELIQGVQSVDWFVIFWSVVGMLGAVVAGWLLGVE